MPCQDACSGVNDEHHRGKKSLPSYPAIPPYKDQAGGEGGGRGAEVYRMNSFLRPSIMGVRYTIVNRLFYSLAVYGQDKFQKRVKVSPLR